MGILKKLASGVLVISMLLSLPLYAAAADPADANITPPLTLDNILSVKNNPGSLDAIVVTGLTAGDIINVYPTETIDPKEGIGFDTAHDDGNGNVIANVALTLPSDGEGYVYITVQNTGKQESTALKVLYVAADASDPLSVENSKTVINNALGTDDRLIVRGLAAGDTIYIYNDALKTKRIVEDGVVADETGTAEIIAPQFTANDDAGAIYLTVKKSTTSESAPSFLPVPAPGTVTIVSDVNPAAITNNAAGTNDTVVVEKLAPGDLIKVYADKELTSLLGTGTAQANGKATITAAQLTVSDAPGEVFLTRTSIGKLESEEVSVPVSTTGATAPLTDANTAPEITNLVGTSDVIQIEGLKTGDKIRVYADKELTALIGSATAASTGKATVTFAQIIPNDGEGTVYITVKSLGKPESPSFAVHVLPAEISDSLTEANTYEPVNRIGAADTIVIGGLKPGDKIKVYSDETTVNLLGTATAVLSGADTAAKAKISIPQVFPNDADGNVYITVTSPGKLESADIAYYFPTANPTTVTLSDQNVFVTNNAAGTNDTVMVSGLNPGDKVKVYSDIKLTNLLGTATAAAATGSATVNIPQLTADDAGGMVYVTVTGKDLLESNPAYGASFDDVAQTDKLPNPEDNVIVYNNALGTSDIVVVNALAPKDKIKVYSDEDLNNLLGTATASAAGSVRLVIPQLPGNDGVGTVYITVTNAGKLESAAVGVDYKEANSTKKLDLEYNKILPLNYPAGKNDTVSISRLAQGDKIRIYADAQESTLLGTATASAAGSVIVSVKQLIVDDGEGYVYITVANLSASESEPLPVFVKAATLSSILDKDFNKIVITNNTAGTNDTVVVERLSQKDLVKVYADENQTVLLGSAAASATGIVTVSIKQLIPNDNSGSVWLTLTGSTEIEGPALKVDVGDVKTSDPLTDAYNDFDTTNNAQGTSDILVIKKLAKGDRVKVYADSACAVLLGSATAPSAGPLTLQIPQLVPGDAAGVVYVTVTSVGKLESPPTEVGVEETRQYYSIDSNPIEFSSNAAGISDTIVVGGLFFKDKVKIYADETKKVLIGTAIAAASGKATFTTPQLIPKDVSGFVYITVSSPGELESNIRRVEFPAAKGTTATIKDNISVKNNAAGTSDTVTVRKLAKGDKVKVYADPDRTKLLGTASASPTTFEAVVTVAQLIPKDESGYVYVTVTNNAALESPVCEADVPALAQTAPIPSSNIDTPVNNAAGTNDTLVVRGLAKGDKVRVYADEAKTSLLGSAAAIAGTSGFTATITARQLSSNEKIVDTVYVTNTNIGAKESGTTPVEVPAVDPSTIPLPGNITPTNNAAGTADVLVVSGLVKGDKVKVYADKDMTALLGSAAAASNLIATIKVPQLNGSLDDVNVYVTVTSYGRTESGSCEVNVPGEAVSITPGSAVTANNAAGTKDTVVVTGLKKGDKVKVYSNENCTNLLGSATAVVTSASSGASTATVSVPQLIAGDGEGAVYVTLTSPGLRESAPLTTFVEAAPQSNALTSGITPHNYAGKSDTVVVTGLAKGDKIKVYSDSKLTNLIGTATATATGKTFTATVTVKQLIANDGAGAVYVTVTNPGKLESKSLKVDVAEADKSDQIIVKNS